MPGALKPNPAGEKPEGLSKYIKRMRTVLRRGSIAKSGSASANMEKPEDKQAGHATPTPTTAAKPPPATSPQPIVISHWGAIQEERTRALFAKYGLSLAHDDCRPVDTSVQRVAKPIRMRVRRSCHRCQTPFGPARVCSSCQHTRCKSCPRHPAPKPAEDTETALRNILAQKGKGKHPHHRNPTEYVLKIPSRTGGQDLVRKPVVQRVRRTCHRCEKVFMAGSKQCEGCEHVRCKKCPRDPPKPEKYPDGYPGDVDPPLEPQSWTWRKPRQRVRYTCHRCSTLYKSGQENCANCGQERCAETIREPPKKIKPEPDPEIVRKVEERLASVRLAE
ncbi:hypothetical protein P170DRAFT_361913 [Aspergillus steynii IBT 23096]|uniref:Uncharacterized protein n=1 Tax=Aspergillus steynii IBT 23096 TaxID=1392250 RepID=A0A2I2G2V7_9EURO|nr:uncharacterized protein P170DRAFT_361913 [Aspergillus steynii IBT 23096]PLB47206.1 hypothetical protein P170DRAFT_361913 [Aspergillus steynii IBT 23096]